MSPRLMTSKGVITGKDMDERKRVDAGGGVEPRQGRHAECAFGRDGVGRELPPREAAGAAVSGGRRQGTEAPECGTCVESRAAEGGARAGLGAGAGEVQRADRGAVWADA